MQLHQVTLVLLLSWVLVLVMAGTIGRFGIPGWALLSVVGTLPLFLTRQIGREPAPTVAKRLRPKRR